MAIKTPDPARIITGGPGLWDLHLALMDFNHRAGWTGFNPRTVVFQWHQEGDEHPTFPKGDIRVDGLIREDDSGENWTILGRIATILVGKWNGFIKIHYSTKTRQGTVLELERGELI